MSDFVVTLGAGDNTSQLQAAHDAAVQTFGRVIINSGDGAVSGPLNWCPYVELRPAGQVDLQTEMDVGNWMHVSNAYGEYPAPNTGKRVSTKPISGSLRIENTNANNAANCFYLGGIPPDETHNAALVQFSNGMTKGWNTHVTYGFNSFAVNWDFWFFKDFRTRAIYMPPDATVCGERITHQHCTFAGDPDINAGSVVGVSNPGQMDFLFADCSYDYITRITDNLPAQYTRYLFQGGHAEWNSADILFSANNNTILVRDMALYSSDLPPRTKCSPFVGAAGPGGRLDVSGAWYLLPSGVQLMYFASDPSAVMLLDRNPDYRGPYRPASYCAGVPGYTQLYHGSQ